MLKARISGVAAFKAGMEREFQAAKGAVFDGVAEETTAVKTDVRRAVSAAFPKGRKVANAVRSKLYDNKTLGAAGIVYSKFGRKQGGTFRDFIAPRLFGATVVPTGGKKWLAIPIHWGRGRGKSKRKRAADLLAAGKLRFVPLKGGRSALLVEQKRFKTTRGQKGDFDTPVYLLVRRVRFPKRADAKAILERAAKRLPGRIAVNYAKGSAARFRK